MYHHVSLTNGLIHSLFQSISSMWWNRSQPTPTFHILYAYPVIYPHYIMSQNRGKAFQTTLAPWTLRGSPTFWPPTSWDQVASMPLPIFLQFLLHLKMSVLYQIQQGTHATCICWKKSSTGTRWKFVQNEVGEQMFRKMTGAVFWDQDWLMNEQSAVFFPNYIASTTSQSLNRKGVELKVLVEYYHTATYTYWGMSL